MTAEFLKDILHPRLRLTVLAHLSETNNNPQLAIAAARKILTRERQTQLVLAHQNIPTQVFSLD